MLFCRLEPSIKSVWMMLPCWRNISPRPAHGILQKQNVPPNKADCMSWRPLSNCPQVGAKCVCVSVYLSASASTAVGIVLYPCHCPFLNIGRAGCEHDSQPVQNTLVCMVPREERCSTWSAFDSPSQGLGNGATSVPDPEVPFTSQRPNHSFLSSDLPCQACQVGWAG